MKHTESTAPGVSRPWILRVMFVLFLAGVTFVLGEMTFRLFLSKSLFFENSERNLLYRYDENIGWIPREASEYTFGDYEIPVRHNRFGFREKEFELVKTKPRVAVFGDSFTWGYNLRAEERFSNILGEHRPDLEVLNFGVSGYGNDQSLILMQHVLPMIAPDIVLLLFCTINDRDENSHNRAHGGYYKPYFVEEGGRLVKCGTPVPRSPMFQYGRHPKLFGRIYWMRALARLYELVALPREITVPDPTERIMDEMQSTCASRGAWFAVGFENRDEKLMTHCDAAAVPYVLLSPADRFPGPSAHWSPAGNRAVADRLRDFLAPRTNPSAVTAP